MAFHSTHRRWYQRKLLVVHSKGGRCNFWDLLLCDDRRSPWWASRDGPPYDCSRIDTVIICMNFNSYASLAISLIIPGSFSVLFWTRNYICYTSVDFVCFLIPNVSLQTFKTRTVHFVFSLRIFVLAHVIITSIRALSMFANLCLVLLLLFASSLLSKFHFQLTKKKVIEKFWKWSDIVQIGRWCYSFSPAPVFVIW